MGNTQVVMLRRQACISRYGHCPSFWCSNKKDNLHWAIKFCVSVGTVHSTADDLHCILNTLKKYWFRQIVCQQMEEHMYESLHHLWSGLCTYAQRDACIIILCVRVHVCVLYMCVCARARVCVQWHILLLDVLLNIPINNASLPGKCHSTPASTFSVLGC